jgi:hypothetical protein
MYTIADLESGEVKPRLSQVFAAPRQVVRWADVARSGNVALRALGSWALSPKPRARVLDVCRVPFAAFGADLRGVLCALPWRKIAIGAGIAFGSLLLFLIAVMTVADLTDDLKPTHAGSAMSANASDVVVGRAAPPAVAPPVAVAPTAVVAAPAPAPDPVLELDSPGQATPRAKPAPKPVAKPKPKRPVGTERFIP